ncbi:MAG: septation ring formation regulator EzrA [Bacilli bacterium]|nr:septation ring formation regulator EzrA [Bacilli bacterium]
MNNKLYIIIGMCIGTMFIILIMIHIMRKSKKDRYKKMIDNLDYQKNELDTSSVGPELAKVESYINNDKLEVMYKNWKERLNDIKEVKIPKITDMLIEAEYSLSKMDYKSTMYKIAKLEMEIYKVRTTSEFLLDEIKDVTNSEERNRGNITKQKAHYRKLYQKFKETQNEYGDYEEIVEKQFETISKRFEDFEILMEKNDITDIPKVFNVIDDMLNHMEVIIEELPSIILIAKRILPKKIEEIKKIYNKMNSEGYPLEYLNVEYNIEEANKKIDDILERAKVLNIEDSLFDLKVLTDYFEKLFTDFEKEKVIKVDYEDTNYTFKNKLKKANNLVEEIFNQMTYLKKTYNLSQNDIDNFNEVKREIEDISKDYKSLINHTNSQNFAYSKLTDSIEELFKRLSNAENKLDSSLNKLGNMHDVEVRAREQLKEVKELLKNAQSEIRTYNLPVIPNSYYVELREAKEAMNEIIKELEKKPITVDVLNTRVDTARDLALKLNGKTKEMMRTAMFSEMAIVYGNRYRSEEKDLDRNLKYSESLFLKGEYKRSLELTINSLNKIEPGIYEKLLEISEKEVK